MDYQDAFTGLASEARRRISKMTPKELTKKKLSPIMIEVREEDEFLNGHVSGAGEVPVRFWIAVIECPVTFGQ